MDEKTRLEVSEEFARVRAEFYETIFGNFNTTPDDADDIGRAIAHLYLNEYREMMRVHKAPPPYIALCSRTVLRKN